jgi:hypothetical protein
VELGVSKCDGRAGGHTLEELAVVRIEHTGAGQLVGYLERSDRLSLRHHGRRHEGGSGTVVGYVHGWVIPRILNSACDDGGARALGHVANEAAAHRHLRADHPLAGAADGQAAGEEVTLGYPEGATFRAQRVEHGLEHLWQQGVEVE